MNVADSKTLVRIYSSAEELFSHHGFHGVSLRQLTDQAGVNLGAINYHFVDKESLYRAVIKRQLQPINQMRLQHLKESELAAGNASVALAVIMEIYARPLFSLYGENETGGHHAARLLGRCLAEPLPFTETLIAAEFHQVTARFAQAIRRHVPRLSPDDFLWRLNFVVGAMQHTLATMYRMTELTRGICPSHDHENALRRFIEFSVATFSAPAASRA